MDWPERGVYFFMEPSERRWDSGNGLRIVRVGTHALKAGSHTTLWKRLSQHKGQNSSDRGNHRASIFRLLVGVSLLNRGGLSCPTWGVDSNAPADVRRAESALECQVSTVIRAMPFLWLPVNEALLKFVWVAKASRRQALNLQVLDFVDLVGLRLRI